MREQLLDGHGVLPVGAEAGQDVGDAFSEAELAFLEQQPRGRRRDRLGAREDHVQRVVGRRRRLPLVGHGAEAAHPGDPAFSRDSHLRRRQATLAHLLLRARKQRLELLGIDADFLRRRGKVMRLGHGDRW